VTLFPAAKWPQWLFMWLDMVPEAAVAVMVVVAAVCKWTAERHSVSRLWRV